MSIELPQALQPVSYLAGSQWPQGDEDKMFALSQAWRDAATALTNTLVPDVTAASQAIGAAYVSGPGRDTLIAALAQLTDESSNQSIQAVVSSMNAVADSADKVGSAIQENKIQILVGLATLVVELASAWLAGPAAPAVEAAEIGATRAALAIAKQIAMEIVKAAAMGALTQAVTDSVIQLVQILQHHRSGFDWGEFGEQVLGGGLGGALGHVAGAGLGKAFDKTLGSAVENQFGGVGKAVGHNVAAGAGGAFGGALGGTLGAMPFNGGQFQWNWAGVAGGVAGVVSGGVRGYRQPSQADTGISVPHINADETVADGDNVTAGGNTATVENTVAASDHSARAGSSASPANNGLSESNGLAENHAPLRNNNVTENSAAENNAPVKNNGLVENNVAAQNSAPVENNVAAQNSAPVENNVAAQSNAPVENSAPVESNVPAQNNAPVQNNGPVQNSAPVESNVPVHNNVPVQNNAPAENNVLAENSVPTQNNVTVADSGISGNERAAAPNFNEPGHSSVGTEPVMGAAAVPGAGPVMGAGSLSGAGPVTSAGSLSGAGPITSAGSMSGAGLATGAGHVVASDAASLSARSPEVTAIGEPQQSASSHQSPGMSSPTPAPETVRANPVGGQGESPVPGRAAAASSPRPSSPLVAQPHSAAVEQKKPEATKQTVVVAGPAPAAPSRPPASKPPVMTPRAPRVGGQPTATRGDGAVAQELSYLDRSASPLFRGDMPSPDDVSQGAIGDCYLLSALKNMATHDPGAIAEMIRDYGDGTVGVRFFNGTKPFWVRVSKELYIDPKSGNGYYAGHRPGDPLWPAMVEKAYASAFGGDKGYEGIGQGGWPAYTTAFLGKGFQLADHGWREQPTSYADDSLFLHPARFDLDTLHAQFGPKNATGRPGDDMSFARDLGAAMAERDKQIHEKWDELVGRHGDDVSARNAEWVAFRDDNEYTSVAGFGKLLDTTFGPTKAAAEQQRVRQYMADTFSGDTETRQAQHYPEMTAHVAERIDYALSRPGHRVMLWTHAYGHDSENITQLPRGVVGGHAYSVVGIERENGKPVRVKLDNPWNTGAVDVDIHHLPKFAGLSVTGPGAHNIAEHSPEFAPSAPEPSDPKPSAPEPSAPEPSAPEPSAPEPSDPEPDPEPSAPEPDPERSAPEPSAPEPDPERSDPEPIASQTEVPAPGHAEPSAVVERLGQALGNTKNTKKTAPQRLAEAIGLDRQNPLHKVFGSPARPHAIVEQHQQLEGIIKLHQQLEGPVSDSVNTAVNQLTTVRRLNDILPEHTTVDQLLARFGHPDPGPVGPAHRLFLLDTLDKVKVKGKPILLAQASDAYRRSLRGFNVVTSALKDGHGSATRLLIPRWSKGQPRLHHWMQQQALEHPANAHESNVVIPQQLNFVWFGGELSAAAVKNLEEWLIYTMGTGWKLAIWTQGDPKTSALGAQLAAHPMLRNVSVHYDVKNLVEAAGNTLGPGFGAQLAEAFETANHYKVYNMASNIARYALLHQNGGVYVDVDISPGAVDLKALKAGSMHPGDIPVLAPAIRDQNSVAATGKNSLREAVDHLYEKGSVNNNFMVAPPKSLFLKGLMKAIPPNLARRLAPFLRQGEGGGPVNKFGILERFNSLITGQLRQDSPTISGPALIQFIGSGERRKGSIADYLFRNYGLEDLTAAEIVKAMDPEIVDAFKGLGWITAESSVQLDKPEGSKSNEPEGSKSNEPEGSKSNEPEGSKSNEPEGSKSNEPEGSKSNEPEGSKSNEPEGSKP